MKFPCWQAISEACDVMVGIAYGPVHLESICLDEISYIVLFCDT